MLLPAWHDGVRVAAFPPFGGEIMSIPVVICDDSSMARKQMARALPGGWDAVVGFAANGLEAVQAVRAGRAEVLFLDLTMPVMDGFETLRALARERLPSKVIVVSGDVQPDARRRALDLGALEFLKKPVDPAELAEVLQRHGLVERQLPEIAAPRPAGAATGVDLRDAVQEIANVAVGQAAAMLARLLNVYVTLPVPNVNTLEAGELRMALAAAGEYDSVSAACQGFIGAGVAGEALLVFNDASFADIARLMKFEGEIDKTAELELLMDMANILIGACLKGIADQLNIQFSQGHPTVLGRHCRVADLLAPGTTRWDRTLAVEMNCRIRDHQVDCDLLLLFTEDSVESLERLIAYTL